MLNDYELLKMVRTFDLNKQRHEKKIEDTDKKIPGLSKSIVSQDFNILMIIKFNAREAKASKIIATKTQVQNTLDLGNKNREKVKKL